MCVVECVVACWLLVVGCRVDSLLLFLVDCCALIVGVVALLFVRICR